MTVRTRFAPSPTGYLHIGGVRTALFNWLLARQAGGQFILRIDDTDAQRNLDEALQPILDGFRWLGIDWDEGPEVGGPHQPYFQSQRLPRYQETVRQLLASGHAYRDYATPAEFAAEREAAEKEQRDFIYSRRWMAETDQQARSFEDEGRSAVVRLKMPREGRCEFHDLVRGEVSFEWFRESDHVIQRADGTCLYHLASVVDDFDYQITHVVRAVEHLSNTPRQIFIAQSLGYPLPYYAHIPYVAEPGSRNKLSKRKINQYLNNKEFNQLYQSGARIASRIGVTPDPNFFNPVLIDFYREIGFLPHAILNYLLLLGWSLDDKTEFFTLEEMLQHFSLDRVVKSEASFDPQKLTAFESHFMNEQPVKQKAKSCLHFLQKAGLLPDPVPCQAGEKLQQIVAAAGDRIVMAGDILQFDYMFLPDQQLEYQEDAFVKRLVNEPAAPGWINEFNAQLATIPSFTASCLEGDLKAFCERHQIKVGNLIGPLRLALTGSMAGFSLFDTMEILGRQSCLNRINRALDKLADYGIEI